MSSDLKQEIARHIAVEAELRAILAALGDAVIAADADGRVTFMNPGAETLTGWPAEQAKGRALVEIFQCATPGVLLTRSNAQVLIEQRTTPLDNGGAGGVVLVFREVASRERADGFLDPALVNARLERAAERAAQLQQITAACSEARAPADVAAVVVTQGCAALGAPRGLLYLLAQDGAALELVQVVDYPPEALAAWRQFPIETDAPLTEAIRIRTALFFETDDAVLTRYPHLASAQHAGDTALAAIPLVVDGRALGVLGFTFAEAHTFDAEERTFILALARQCAQALERARLYEAAAQARAAAEAANHAKDEFLAMLSHELRTPLTAILGWANILRTSPLVPSAQERGLQTIERNAHLLVQLIEDILDVSRIVADKLRLELQPVDPIAIVRDAIDLVRASARTKQITLEDALEDGIESLTGDRARLQQITWNLLSNAIKFTPRGGRIEVRLDRIGAGVRLRVIDAGEGIHAAFLPHVFEHFRQADSSRTRAHGGLGLGLAIVKHLVELHDGTITVESGGIGRGATFTVTLPMSMRTAVMHG
jgi:signal transduction histidine kinase